jgi:hypothetical protein
MPLMPLRWLPPDAARRRRFHATLRCFRQLIFARFSPLLAIIIDVCFFAIDAIFIIAFAVWLSINAFVTASRRWMTPLFH